MRPFDAQTALPGLISKETCTVKCDIKNSGYKQNLVARIEKLMFRDPSKMTILRHLNLAGAKVKSTLRLNLTMTRERLSNCSQGTKSYRSGDAI